MSEALDFDTEVRRSTELNARVGFANMILSMYDSSQAVPHEIRQGIAEQLDPLWDERYLECTFSGWCAIAENHGGFREFTDHIDIAKGVSDGFWVTRFGSKENGSWAVGLGFRESVPHDDVLKRHVIIDSRAPYGIVPLVAVESAFPEGLDFPSLESVLNEDSDTLAKVLNYPIFFTFDPYQQKKFINEKLAETTEKCDEFGGIKDRAIGVDASKGFLYKTEGGVHYDSIDISRCPVKGTCEGLVVLPMLQLSQDRPIRLPGELVDPNAGFCLAIRVDDTTAKRYGLELQERVHVPISGQQVDAYFDASSISQL